MYTKLLAFWEKAAKELRFEIEVPFSLLLDSDHEVKALFLVKQFGAPNGMLILSKNEDKQPYSDEIISAGYGYSVLSEPLKNEEFDSDDFIELLEDWGWSGSEESRPF
jgi:hypothetical protein